MPIEVPDGQTLKSVKETLKALYPTLEYSQANRDIYDDPEELTPGTYSGQIVRTRIYTNKKGEQGTALAIKLDSLADPATGVFRHRDDLGTYEVFFNYSKESRFYALLDLYKGLAVTVTDNGKQVPISSAEQVADADPTGMFVKVNVKISKWGENKPYIAGILPSSPASVRNAQSAAQAADNRSFFSSQPYDDPPF